MSKNHYRELIIDLLNYKANEIKKLIDDSEDGLDSYNMGYKEGKLSGVKEVIELINNSKFLTEE